MKTPLFSVIIPALNEEKFLPKLLESLAQQTEKNFEVIVVDGKSKDKTVAVAQSFEKKLPGLTVITGDKASLPYQRNFGANHARGSWYIFVDADSVLLPHCIARSHEFINGERPDLFTTWYCADSQTQGEAVTALLGNIVLEGYLMFHKPCIPGPFTVVSKRAYHHVGGYDEDHAYHEDFNFSIRIYESGHRVRIMHETCYIISLRRIRKEGSFAVMEKYIRSTLYLFLFNKTMKKMPGYIMGGQNYTKHVTRKMTLLSVQKKIQRIIQELFSL